MRTHLARIAAALILIMATPSKFEALAQQEWIAMQTEARGIILQIPRDFIHLRGSDGTIELGIDIKSFRPLALLGISQQVFWERGGRVRVNLSEPFSGAASVQNALRFSRDIGRVQTLHAAEQLDDTTNRQVPQGLIYYPGRLLPSASDVRLRRVRTRDLFLLHEPAGFDSQSGEGLPEFIECAVQYEEKNENKPVPCEWYRVFRGLFIRLTIDRHHLHRWREIRHEIEELLSSFVVNARDWALPPTARSNAAIPEPKLIYNNSD
ncbi:hypothetical protein J8J14_00045 [Roseomonas sp. SSH11]|uniref:Uncharacterized protein n=1 Tax=Pararoseomonas baculiformis TaxID=2820812 RepID=A0ABS4AA24_9PROT|nr:hypothetical protein [Pararoseomonas baculiformis]MBP0443154.1 hypothetical protein [Pararoseomonas baculiformis]